MLDDGVVRLVHRSGEAFKLVLVQVQHELLLVSLVHVLVKVAEVASLVFNHRAVEVIAETLLGQLLAMVFKSVFVLLPFSLGAAAVLFALGVLEREKSADVVVAVAVLLVRLQNLDIRTVLVQRLLLRLHRQLEVLRSQLLVLLQELRFVHRKGGLRFLFQSAWRIHRAIVDVGFGCLLLERLVLPLQMGVANAFTLVSPAATRLMPLYFGIERILSL